MWMIRTTALALLLAATPAMAAEKSDPNLPAVEATAALMRERKAEAALVAIAAPLAAYEAQFGGDQRAQFCPPMTVETALSLMRTSKKRSAVLVPPGWCEALFLKAFALIDLGRIAEGLPFLDRAVRMAPQNAHYLNELGYAHQALKDWPRSIKAYESAQAAAGFAPEAMQNAERTRALRGIGFCLVEQGKWDEAKAAYEKALAIDPKDTKSEGELRFIAENRPKLS